MRKSIMHKLVVFLAILVLLSTVTGCEAVKSTFMRIFPKENSVCPTNDSRYFFRQNGTKPTKQFRRNNR